ncbi:MAG: heavy metal translocating P-type ATPase [Huintestinicola sp.]
MTRKQKKVLIRIIVSFALLIAAAGISKSGLLPEGWYFHAAVYLVPYIIIGWDILKKAAVNIINGQIFDENFLMALATVGAFVTGEYAEGTAVMLFYQVGELFQSYAVNKSRRSIASLMDIRPDYANIEDENGELIQVSPEDVQIDDIIIVKAGERVPLDGIVLEGSSTVDTSALTGESVPREVQTGDDVISGCINLSGLIRIKVKKAYGESTVSKILELVENASEKKSVSENFISKFAKYYTPAVVIGAVILAVVPPLITHDSFIPWIQRAFTFLVISCPCALVISVPLSFFGGIGGASKCGVLVKGSSFLEALSKVDTIVFDKTGTLTKGCFEVSSLHPHKTSSDTELLDMASHAECYSDHPISRSLINEYEKRGQKLDNSRISDVEEIAGHGVTAVIDGHSIAAGNIRLMNKVGADAHECHKTGTAVHVSRDGNYCGHIIISDLPKASSAEAIKQLKANGITKTVMLTGDSKAVGESVAEELGLDEVHTELLPGDKVSILEKLLEGSTNGRKVAFVGDGINDAPVLTRADIGIAMGALGSDAAIEAADVVLMDDDPMKIVSAIKISRKTLSIVYQNIIFALGVKLIVLILGALGHANMWAAVFADVGVSVIAILNAMRALSVKQV